MEVILLENVGSLGSLGDKVTVKSGYARNFLFPQGKAVPATKVNVEKLYNELQEQLPFQESHKLLSEDIHFANGAGNSMRIQNNNFFKKFEK